MLERTRTPRVAALALLVALLAIGTGAHVANAQAERSAEDIMRVAHLNQFYTGDDGVAHVQMTITNSKGKTRDREFYLLRIDLEEGGPQKYFAYFLKPSDVRRTSFMAWKNPDEQDSRWIYVPALDLVKPISADDKKSSFVGSDFSYEDVSGRHWSEDTHAIVSEEELDGRSTWVIESTPRGEDYFTRKKTWVDKEWTLPLREEFYYGDDEQPDRVYESLAIEEVDGYLTAVQRRMTNVGKENVTDITFETVDYDIGVEDDVFSERYLKSPPRKYFPE